MCRSVVENLQEHLSPPPSSSGVGGGSGGGAEGGQWTHTAGEALLCDVLGAFFMNVMQLGGEGLSWFTGMATGMATGVDAELFEVVREIQGGKGAGSAREAGGGGSEGMEEGVVTMMWNRIYVYSW